VSVLAETEKIELHDRLRQLMQSFPNWREKKHNLPPEGGAED
jgi:hypothetical protein